MNMTNNRAKELLNEAIRIAIEDADIDNSLIYLSDIGCTRSEALQYIDNHFLCNYDWKEEDKDETKTASVPIEEVSVGDSDQAILETALTQIGIPYTWEGSRDGDGGWIDLKIVDDGEVTNDTATEIYFTKDGKFEGLY